MKFRKVSWWWVVALAAAWLAVPGGAAPASLSGKASTVLEWYDSADEEQALPAYQYLLLNVRDVATRGLHLRGYGRLADDLNNEVDVDSELYYAYLEHRNLMGDLGFRLGRQFIATTAGASVVDGLRLDWRNLGPLHLRAYGGGDVAFDEDYSAEDLTWGGEVAGRFLDDAVDVSAGYLQKWDDDALEAELFGADANLAFANLFDLYGEWQFNLLTNATSYFLGGLEYHQFGSWTLRGEYLYSLPVFESTSIYSVFAVDAYEEFLGELTYHWRPGLRSFARVTYEIYESFANAAVYEAGIEQIATGRFSGYLLGTWREDDDGQDLRGIKLRAAYFFAPYVRLGAGAHFDVLERDLDDDEDTTAKRFWGDATVYFSKRINLEGKVERVESELWDDYHRGRLRLNVRF